ncbi:MAG: C25 family cysteine peptidase [Myxococcales bacterium]
MIKVPEYSNVTINSGASLAASTWNGTTGGVLAFLATGTVTNRGTITAATRGFRGGVKDNVDSGNDYCGYTGDPTGTPPVWAIFSEKGEGIVPARYETAVGTTAATRGRLNISIAGGGADADNSGGGGGANYGAGGLGGNTWVGDGSSSTAPTTCRADSTGVGRANAGGMGGAPVVYSTFDHLTLGGGGGAGHGNNDGATAGAPGGGIIWFRANQLTGSGGVITASGGSAAQSVQDGAGGGGAGGTVVVRLAGTCDNNAITASGGSGGNISHADPHGPGGGGGAGRVAFQSTSTLGTGTTPCTATATSGAAGIWVQGQNNDHHGATPPAPQTVTGAVAQLPGRFTAVTLLAFAQHPSPSGGIELRWETGSEFQTIGFLVHRDSATGPLVSERPVRGLLTSPLGERYALNDPEGTSSTRYYLEELSLRGASIHGPAGTRPGAAGPLLPKHSFRRDPRARDPQPALRLHRPSRPQATEAFVDVEREGVYSLPRGSWRSVSLDGTPVPTFPSPGGELLFYAPPPTAPERMGDSYRLEANVASSPGRASAARPPVGAPVASFTSTVHFEEHHFLNVSAGPEDRYLWGWAYSGMAPQAFTVELPDYVDGPVVMSLTLMGLKDFGKDPQHHAVIEVNGRTSLDAKFGPNGPVSYSVTIPAGVMRAGANTVSLAAVSDLGLPYDLLALSSIDVTYTRAYVASGDALTFTADASASVEVAGFSSPPVLLDMTHPALPTLVRGTQEFTDTRGSGIRFLRGGRGTRRYFAAVPLTVPVRPSRASEVPAGRADYVAIVGEGLDQALAPLLALRRAQGLSVASVPVEALYDRFSHGQHGPQAIKTYLARMSPPPSYVLLVGKASADPHDYLGLGVPDLVPTPLPMVEDAQMFSPADALLVAGANGRTPFAAIGRLPVLGASEFSAWVDRDRRVRQRREPTDPPCGPCCRRSRPDHRPRRPPLPGGDGLDGPGAVPAPRAQGVPAAARQGRPPCRAGLGARPRRLQRARQRPAMVDHRSACDGGRHGASGGPPLLPRHPGLLGRLVRDAHVLATHPGHGPVGARRSHRRLRSRGDGRPGERPRAGDRAGRRPERPLGRPRGRCDLEGADFPRLAQDLGQGPRHCLQPHWRPCEPPPLAIAARVPARSPGNGRPELGLS